MLTTCIHLCLIFLNKAGTRIAKGTLELNPSGQNSQPTTKMREGSHDQGKIQPE